MGACCCRPKSPCGSRDERSGLLKDDTQVAAVPAGHLVATTGSVKGTCGPQGDIRKMTDTVTLKTENTDDAQLTLLPQLDPSETIVARENGSLLREDALEENAGIEKSPETFPARKGSPDLPREADRQWEGGDWRPASPVQVEIQDGGPDEAQMSVGDDVSDVCRRDDVGGDAGSKVANGCTPATTLCWNDEDEEAEKTCREKTSESSCSVNENSEDGECSALTSGQDQTGHETSAEAAEAKLGGDERRPAHSNHLETPRAAPEVASGPTEKQQENPEPRAGEDREDEEEMEDVEVNRQTEESEVTPAEGSLRSSEEDLYGEEEEAPSSPADTRAAPPESNAPEARCSLGPAVDILSYSRREWRGNTAKSALIRKGYTELSQHFAAVRQVRGDNYCALRATLFQVLSQASQVPAWLQDDDCDVAEDLSELTGQWTFPGETETQPDVAQRLQNSLEILRNKWHAAARCPSAAERRQLCAAAFGGGEEEAAMLEALKLLMLRRAVRLHADMCGGGDVPLFCWLLFARDSSDCPRAFLANHLSRVGVSAGLEQVEMCLLGDALRCTLQVYRLYMVDGEEFVACYPDEHKDDWPRVSLVTEDDRHYNVPVAYADREEAEQAAAAAD
ncbi:uncharacterized protein LOC144040253 [Vanacampus margaritifer]